MSSENQERDNPSDLAWTKAPANNEGPGLQSETNRETDAGSAVTTDQNATSETMAMPKVENFMSLISA